ncbi:unnamed protein product [Amoebophrya sp. A120]|nr:unnamed protein product [Amoebophrya sp. A120]|eukprot:GSA120T00025072001.1
MPTSTLARVAFAGVVAAQLATAQFGMDGGSAPMMGGGIPDAPPPTDEQGRPLQSIKIEAPQITEEDQHGYNMPAMYMCNSCKSVMFHTNATFFNRGTKSREGKLREWEVEDMMEKACSPDVYEGYGVKLLNGKNVLSGPALAAEEKELAGGQATIQMGGDNWKKRLSEVCTKIIRDEMEEDAYKIFLQGKLDAKLCSNRFNYCSVEATGGAKKAKKQRTAKKEKKKTPEKVAPASGAKKLSVDAYLTKLARSTGADVKKFTASRTEQEWAEFFADVPVMPGMKLAKPGKDEL